MGRSAKGFTLLEVLVVLVLASLLGTLLLEGVGFFLARYETVQHVYRESSRTVLQQHWFASTVGGMVPYRQQDRRFAGDATSFGGITINPLNAPSGMPAGARWSIHREGSSSIVRYAEDDVSTNAGADWIVLASGDQDLAFQYADAAHDWHDDWPPGPASGPIPTLVRLVSGAQRTIWLAGTALFPEPVRNHDP